MNLPEVMDIIEELEAALIAQREHIFLLREMAALPVRGTYKDGIYHGIHQQWYAMSEEEREERRQRVDDSIEYMRKMDQQYRETLLG